MDAFELLDAGLSAGDAGRVGEARSWLRQALSVFVLVSAEAHTLAAPQVRSIRVDYLIGQARALFALADLGSLEGRTASPRDHREQAAQTVEQLLRHRPLVNLIDEDAERLTWCGLLALRSRWPDVAEECLAVAARHLAECGDDAGAANAGLLLACAARDRQRGPEAVRLADRAMPRRGRGAADREIAYLLADREGVGTVGEAVEPLARHGLVIACSGPFAIAEFWARVRLAECRAAAGDFAAAYRGCQILLDGVGRHFPAMSAAVALHIGRSVVSVAQDRLDAGHDDRVAEAQWAGDMLVDVALEADDLACEVYGRIAQAKAVGDDDEASELLQVVRVKAGQMFGVGRLEEDVRDLGAVQLHTVCVAGRPAGRLVTYGPEGKPDPTSRPTLVERCTRYLDQGFDDARTRMVRGLDLLGAGDLDGALADFDRAIALDPGRARAYYLRGRVQRRSGDLVAARDDLVAAVARALGNAAWRVELGEVLVECGDLDGALARAADALALEPTCGPAHLLRGRYHAAHAEWSAAVAAYDQALALCSSGHPFLYRAHALRQLGDLRGALDDLAHGLNQPQNDDVAVAAMRERAEIHEELGEVANAAKLRAFLTEQFGQLDLSTTL